MTKYLATLNQRQQVTLSVADKAATYANLASATWRLQVRISPGAPDVLLDSTNGVVTYSGGAAPVVTFQWPRSAVANLQANNCYFDFGFTLPGADFELAGDHTVSFLPGVTQAGVPGSPAAPAGADDTWTVKGAPALASQPSLASAVAAASASAADADASASSAATAASSSAASAAASSAAAAAAAFPIALQLDFSTSGEALMLPL